jgi:hypothetical protein
MQIIAGSAIRLKASALTGEHVASPGIAGTGGSAVPLDAICGVQLALATQVDMPRRRRQHLNNQQRGDGEELVVRRRTGDQQVGAKLRVG